MLRVAFTCLVFCLALVAGCGDDDGTPTDAGGPRDAGPAVDGAQADAGTGSDAAGVDAGGDDASLPPLPSCDFGALGATGAVHYVCDCGTGADPDCVAGDDANDGLDPARALRTYEAARTTFGTLAAGDTVALCSGGSFTVGTANRWVNANCRAGVPCFVRPYAAPWATGDEDLPTIHLDGDGRVFAFEDGGDPEHEEGYVLLDLNLQGSGQGWAVFVYNDADDITMCGLVLNNFSIGVHVGGSNPVGGGTSDGRNARIVLRGSRVTNNEGQGWLGACNGCAVEGSHFENNGFGAAVFNHNIYFSGSDTGASVGMRAVGNDLYRSAFIAGTCQGVSLVVHGEHDGLVIEGNTVHEDVGAAGGGCWGIAMDTGYAEAEGFRNVTIRGNTVVNVGNVGIGLDACDHCVIENNVIVQQQSFGSTAIAIPDRDRDPMDLAMTNVTVRNNSIYSTADGVGIRLEGEGAEHVVVSNAIHYAGTGAWDCFSLGLATSAYRVVDDNLCFGPTAGSLEWESGSGDLAAWRTASSFDASSLSADPAFTAPSAPAHDLRPSGATSPCVGAGHPTESAPTDITGAPRDAAPDLGAYEL